VQDASKEARSELQAAGRYMMEHGLAWGNADYKPRREWPS